MAAFPKLVSRLRSGPRKCFAALTALTAVDDSFSLGNKEVTNWVECSPASTRQFCPQSEGQGSQRESHASARTLA